MRLLLVSSASPARMPALGWMIIATGISHAESADSDVSDASRVEIERYGFSGGKAPLVSARESCW